MGLFEKKDFIMHSGGIGRWKIEFDTMTDEDIDCLAFIIADCFQFADVVGVPTTKGGIDNGRRLATALEPYRTHGPLLIVDDVLTTGASMEAERIKYPGLNDIIGVVIFARSKPPEWVYPMWQLWNL